jgi:PAS domain S-box-containing protein
MDLPQALKRGELFLVYQPIVDIFLGKIVSYEALIRWRHPGIGIISPSLFIPIAENTGLITAIDLWVLESVVNQNFNDIPVHVNLSGYDLSQIGFIRKVEALIHNKKDKIVLEFTETAQINFSPQLIADIKALGVVLAVDDFGTGYSSMYLLNTLKVNLLKIDIHFVQNMLLDIDSAVIVESIINLGQSLNMDVIAEGVETIEQLHHLYRIGCRLIQGFYISKPMMYDDLSSFDPDSFKLSPQEKYIHDNEDFVDRLENKSRIMIELDEKLNYIRLTDNFCAYLGYEMESLKGHTFHDLVSPENKDYFSIVLGQLFANHYVDNVVINLIRKDWTLRSTLFTARYNTHESGTMIVYLEDYAYYQEKLNEIGGVHNAYSIMFHEGPLATIVWNNHYAIVDWNKESENVFGWAREEAIGKNVIKLLTFDDKLPHTNTFEAIFLEKGSDFILSNITKDGKQISCRWNNRAILNVDGKVQFILSMVTDITENLIKNDNIRMLSAAIDKSGSAVIVTDQEGFIEYTNSQFNAMTGYAQGLIGQNINCLSSHEQKADYYKCLWNTIKKGETWSGKLHNRKKNGESYWCTSTITPIKSELSGKVNFICIQQDITQTVEKEKDHLTL